mgnify:CR=1 FL=1
MRVEIVNQLSPPGLAGMICKRINNKVLIYGGSYFPENEPLKTSKVQSNRIYVYDDEFKLLLEQEGKIYPDKGIVIQEENIIYYIQSSSIYKISLTDKVEEECLGNFDFEIESGYGCKIDEYLFFGYKQSFQFNLLTGELIRKKDFPVEGRAQGVSVLYKNELYYLGGANHEAYTNGYKYNFENDDSIKNQFGFNDSDRSDIDSVKEVLDKGDAFVDMYATTPKNKRAVSVMILKSDSDLDTFLDKQLSDLDPSLDASKTTVNVLGKEVKGIRYTINGKDSKVYQKLAFIRRGEYVMVIISGGIYAAAPQTGFDSIEILDNQEELENAEKKDNSNEVISTAESTETASEDVEVQIGEIENDIYTNKMFGLYFDGKSNDMIFASKEEANKNFYDTGKNESDIKEVKNILIRAKNLWICMP